MPAEPIRVWLTPTIPNPWKVVLVLEELKVPYQVVSFRFDDIKKPPFINMNPNASVPGKSHLRILILIPQTGLRGLSALQAIEDPNTGVTLWESGAIVTYLIDRYDRDLTLTYPDDRVQDKYALHQWLHFQMSLQGPFFHQAGW